MSDITKSIHAFTLLNAQANPIDLSLEAAPMIPQKVYEVLPPFLQELCLCFDEPVEKDVFLTAALPVISAHLPNIWTKRRDGLLSVDLYTAVVAPFGSGKGIASFARRLGNAADREIIERTKHEMEQWKKATALHDTSADAPKECPAVHGLFCPADSSAAAFRFILQASGGRTVIFENEIDTLTQTLNKEWGSFSDILRKAFHHEPVSHSRIQSATQDPSKAFMHLEKPSLSVFLSGTDAQLLQLLGRGGVENGLYSRFALYYLNSTEKWLSSAPTDNFDSRERAIEQASSKLADLHRRLELRDASIQAVLSPEHYSMIDATFSQYRSSWLQANPAIARIVQRSAVIAQRIAIALSALRFIDSLPTLDQYTVDDDDMETAITLALLFFDHSARFAIARLKSKVSNDVDRKNLVFELKRTGYSSREIAEKTGVSKSTVNRWIEIEQASVSS